MKTLLIALVSFAGLGMAQNCVATSDCHIDQTSTTQVIAENQQNVCFFTQSAPEIITIACKHGQTTMLNATLTLSLGGCQTGNFLGSTDIQWTFCRVTASTYSWEVEDDTSFVKTGTLL